MILCIHGGGYTGLTWSLLAAKVASRCASIKLATKMSTHPHPSSARVFAPDLRGHGATSTADDERLDINTLVADLAALWAAAPVAAQHPPVVLVGHSMGGALAVHAAAAGTLLPDRQTHTQTYS